MNTRYLPKWFATKGPIKANGSGYQALSTRVTVSTTALSPNPPVPVPIPQEAPAWPASIYFRSQYLPSYPLQDRHAVLVFRDQRWLLTD